MSGSNLTITANLGTIVQFQAELMGPKLETIPDKVAVDVNKVILEHPDVIIKIITDALL